MKKEHAVPPPARGSPWFALALVSLAVNAALLYWVFRPGSRPVEPVPAVVAPMAPIWTRELAPYAALGSFMAENNRIPDLKWSAAQFAAFQEGFRSSYEGRGLPLD